MARFREGTGTGLLVAIGSLSIYAGLAWAVVFLLWIALSVYALVEMFGDGRPSALAVMLIVVLLVGNHRDPRGGRHRLRRQEPDAEEARPGPDR